MKSLCLDVSTHDIDVSSGALKLINDTDRIKQKIKIKLLWFYGEWFLDTTVGVKYHENVFKSNPNLILIDNMFKSSILEIEEVNTLLTYDSEYDSSNRTFTVSFSVDTSEGVIENTEVIS